MAPDGNLPESYDAKKHIEALEARINELNEKLIEQDHRFWHSVFVLVKKFYSKDKSHLGAAVKAVAQNLIPSGRTIVLISGGSLIGVFTLYLMFLNNQLVAKQNYHLQQQNYLNTKANIEQQLIESKRILYEEKEIIDEEGNKQTVSAHRPETRKEAFNFYLEARKTQDALVSPIEPERTTFVSALSGLFTRKKFAEIKPEEVEQRIDIDLRGAYLTNIDFYNIKFDSFKLNLLKANLQEAILWDANLQEADLNGANLREADLEKANLIEADLEKANLREANLQKAYLREANLQKANLWKANLQEASLSKANLREANIQDGILYKTNLQEANLQEANLQNGILYKVNLRKARLLETVFTNALLEDVNLNSAELLTCAQLSKAIKVYLTKNIPIDCKEEIKRSEIRAKLHRLRQNLPFTSPFYSF